METAIKMTHKELKTLEKPINMTHKEPKTLEKPIKTIKTMIFKLSPGATPPSGDGLKIMVFMVFIGFSNVFGFQNTQTLEKPINMTHKEPKTLEKPIKTIKTMIFKLSPGATPPSGDSFKIMVFMVFIGFSKVFGFQNTETLEKPIKSARRGTQNIGKTNKSDT